MARQYKTQENTIVLPLGNRNLKIKQLLKKNKKVCIKEFGCFTTKGIASRRFLDRHNHVTKHTTPYIKIKFKPSVGFKKYINE